MAIKVQKPVLVVGMSLSVALWLWQSLAHVTGEWGIGIAMTLGIIVWLFPRKQTESTTPVNISAKEIQLAITQVKEKIQQITQEAPQQDVTQLQMALKELSDNDNTRESLVVAIAGGKRVGKTTLKELLESNPPISHVKLIEEQEQKNLEADIILYMTDGDITATQWQQLKYYQSHHQRCLLLFNKQDQYTPEVKQEVLLQLKQRVAGMIGEEDIIACAVNPMAVKVRKYGNDGNVEQWWETPTADLGGLCDRLQYINTYQRTQLLLATTWRQAISLKQQSQQILHNIRKQQSLPIIEKYQWLSGATVGLNPVASIDLLATVAINAQMLVDLGAVYQHPLSLAQAQNATVTIGKMLLKLGLVEICTQSIATVLKTNLITYAAGGLLQGVSAAYLTRITGLSLIEYLQDSEPQGGLNLEKLGEKLKEVFNLHQKSDFIQGFVQAAIGKINYLRQH